MAVARRVDRDPALRQNATSSVAEAVCQLPYVDTACLGMDPDEDFETLFTKYVLDDMPGTTSVSEWSEDGTEMEAIRAWYKMHSWKEALEADEARWACERINLPDEVKIILQHIFMNVPEVHVADAPGPGLPVRARIYKSIERDLRIEQNHFGPRGDLLLRSSLREYPLGVLGLSVRWWRWLTYKDKTRLQAKKFDLWNRHNSFRVGSGGVPKRCNGGAVQHHTVQGTKLQACHEMAVQRRNRVVQYPALRGRKQAVQRPAVQGRKRSNGRHALRANQRQSQGVGQLPRIHKRTMGMGHREYTLNKREED